MANSVDAEDAQLSRAAPPSPLAPFQLVIASVSKTAFKCPRRRSPIRDVADALADPQVAARHGTVEVRHPALGDVRQVASPFRITGYDGEVRRGPHLGEHTEEVLVGMCGYTSAQVTALADDGVFGVAPGVAPLSQEVDA